MLENRPSKKQSELLNFIDEFIKSNGYGPSYREIMRSLDYKSVSTVAVHIDGLIARGLLRKTDNSARSLEVVKEDQTFAESTHAAHIDWLEREIAKRTVQKTAKSQKEIAALGEALAIFKQPNKNQDELSA